MKKILVGPIVGKNTIFYLGLNYQLFYRHNQLNSNNICECNQFKIWQIKGIGKIHTTLSCGVNS